ncbi:MAG: hypothetical protein NTZ61_03945, partial [Proteobacteria bacterium]|nr:hypothetical protein [Pseudomonadota bacterium]
QDNDGDGLVDLSDPGCVDATDASENASTPGCDDGIDNDADGLIDMTDFGCPFPEATLEDPPCNDDLDNDGDGLVDFADPECTRAWPYWESNSCGLGAELAIVVPLLVAWRRRTRLMRT